MEAAATGAIPTVPSDHDQSRILAVARLRHGNGRTSAYDDGFHEREVSNADQESTRTCVDVLNAILDGSGLISGTFYIVCVVRTEVDEVGVVGTGICPVYHRIRHVRLGSGVIRAFVKFTSCVCVWCMVLA